MTTQDDCYFFYNSTCAKNEECPYRHEPRATGNPVCDQWKSGLCTRNPCHFRHAHAEMQSQCYYENQPSGCLNSSCTFTHLKPRPLLTSFNPLPRPRLNVPYQSRFGLPNSQMFGSAYTHAMSSPPKTRHQPPYRGPRPLMYSNNIGMPFQSISPNMYNQNSFNITNPTSAAQKNIFRPPNLLKDSHDSNISGQRGNESNIQAIAADVIRPSSDNGFFPTPGRPSPFSLDQLIQFKNMVSPEIVTKQKDRSAARRTYKRTVKKYEGIRNRKNERESKRREKTTLQDENAEKKKKKEKRSATKAQKDNSSKVRKAKRGRNVLKSNKIDGKHRPEATIVSTKKGEEEDTHEEINLGFKVKSLEEILRDKALKKLLERQKNAAEADGTTQPETAETATTNDNDKSANIIYTTKEVLQNEEQCVLIATEQNVKNLKRLKPLKPLKPLKTTKRKSLDNKNMNGTTEEKKDVEQKKPLPPLKRLKPLSKTQGVESTTKVLKRKFETNTDEIQLLPSYKVKKIETVVVNDSPPSEDERKSHSKIMSLADKNVVKCMDFETASKKELTQGNEAKFLTKKRSIVVHKSVQGTSSKKSVGSCEKNVRKFRIEDKMLLLLENAEKEATKNEQNSQEPAVNTNERLAKKFALNSHLNSKQKPVGKIVKLSTSRASASSKVTNTTTTDLKQDTQCISNSEQSKTNTVSSGNGKANESKPVSLELSGANAGVQNTRKKTLNNKTGQIPHQDENVKTNDKMPSLPLNKKPVRMIKLNRERLTDKKNDSQNNEGVLVRKMKVNKTKPLGHKQAVVKPVSIDTQQFVEKTKMTTTSRENTKEVTTEMMSTKKTTVGSSGLRVNVARNKEKTLRLNEITSINEQKRPETAMVKPMVSNFRKTTGKTSLTKTAEGSRILIMTDGNSTTASDGTVLKPSVNMAKKSTNDVKSDVQTRLDTEGNERVPLTKANKLIQQQKTENVDSPVLSNQNTKEKRETETNHDTKDKLVSDENQRRKDSLNRLVKEVTEDIKDEGEDFLDEALEKAIAELSPVNTDDEEDVSNADDLLLEIEEMINS